jgi:hypothetical protein
MWGQARRSEGIMGFDTRMIAGSCACSTSSRPTQSNIINRANRHHAEALQAELAGYEAGLSRQGGMVMSIASMWVYRS